MGGAFRETENEQGRGTRTIPGKKAPRFTAPSYLMALGFLLLQSKVHPSKEGWGVGMKITQPRQPGQTVLPWAVGAPCIHVGFGASTQN